MSFFSRQKKENDAEVMSDNDIHFALFPLYEIRLKQLVEEKRISDEQADSLQKMIESEDVSNGLLAFTVIDNFDKDEYSI
jgi:hypothetical protein